MILLNRDIGSLKLSLLFFSFGGELLSCKKNSRLRILVCVLVEVALLSASKFLPDTIDNIFCFSSLARYYPCFVAGAILREFDISSIRNRWIGLGLILIAILGFGHWSSSGDVDFLLYILGYVASAILLFYFIKVIEGEIPRFLSSQLGIIGRYSLNIYIIHFFLVPHLVDGLPDSFVVHLAYSLVLAIVISYVSIIIGKFLTTMTPLDKVLK